MFEVEALEVHMLTVMHSLNYNLAKHQMIGTRQQRQKMVSIKLFLNWTEELPKITEVSSGLSYSLIVGW
jgi:hypothetical protein